MNPWFLVSALIAIFVAGSAGFKLGIDHQKASEADKRELVAEAVDAANSAAAEAISQIKVTNQTIRQEVERETRTNTVYVDCRHTPAGMSGVNAALGGAEPAGGGKLPQTDPAKR